MAKARKVDGSDAPELTPEEVEAAEKAEQAAAEAEAAEVKRRESLTPEERAVEDAAKALAEAKKVADAAQAEHAAAVAAHAAAVEATQPKLTPGKHIFVDLGATGVFSLMDAPPGWDKDYRLTVQGKNVEHVGDVEVTGEDGAYLGVVWQYRGM